MRLLVTNILAYPPTGRGNSRQQRWSAQRDQTRQLTEFDSIALRETRKIFFVPLHMMATLDDDLFGTRAADNQVKMLRSRKADNDRHSADAVADVLFRVILALRFRRKGEVQLVSVRKLLETLLEGRGEESLSSLIVTADRSHGKEAFMELFMEFGLFPFLSCRITFCDAIHLWLSRTLTRFVAICMENRMPCYCNLHMSNKIIQQQDVLGSFPVIQTLRLVQRM